MCKAKRMTRAELEDKIIDHAKRCKKYKPNAAIREHEDYLRIVRRFGKGAVKNEKKETAETEAADLRQLTACRNMLTRLRARKNGKCSLSDG